MIVNPIGTKGGLVPLIVVTAPTGSVVTCDSVQGTEVSGTWTFHVAIGTHTIVATLGTKTKTETVNVDKVGLFSLTIQYITEIYTDFATKDPAWVETKSRVFQYSSTNGLVVPEDIHIYDSDEYAWLEINGQDMDLSNAWSFEFQTYMYTSVDSRIGALGIVLKDSNDSDIFIYSRSDGWRLTKGQAVDMAVNNTNIYSVGQTTSLNGATVKYKVEYANGTLKLYVDDALSTTRQMSVSGIVKKIRIGAYNYRSSYTTPLIYLNYIDLKG